MSVTRALSINFPRLNAVLGHAFPLFAVAGLLLAGWGLIVTPDDIRAGGDTSFWKLMKTAETSADSTYSAAPPTNAAAPAGRLR